MRQPSFVLHVFALAACGGGDSASVDAQVFVPGDDAYRPDRIGYVQLVEGGPGEAFAAVQDRPELPTAVLAEREGECGVYTRPREASCSPACSNGVCTATNTCTPFPANASAGPITVTGLRQPLTFRLGPYGYVPEPAPGEDMFDADATIQVSASGAVTPAFQATLDAVAPLEAPMQNLTLVDDEDAAITWSAANDARIQVALVVGWHGAPYEAMLLCETADDGALVIPRSIISKLPRARSGLESHPSWITRFERGVVMVPAGPIEIMVGSQVPIYFVHP